MDWNPGVCGRGLWRVAMLGVVVGIAAGAAATDAPSPEAPPGEIRFMARNLIVKARGSFHEWRFKSVEYRDRAPGIDRVEVEIVIASVDTGIGRRDRHLRTADFFDAEKYPVATLRFYDIEPRSGDGKHYKAKLDFDLHGVVRTYDGFVFEVIGSDPLEVEGAFEIDRTDFGVGGPKTRNPFSITDVVPIEFRATLPPR